MIRHGRMEERSIGEARLESDGRRAHSEVCGTRLWSSVGLHGGPEFDLLRRLLDANALEGRAAAAGYVSDGDLSPAGMDKFPRRALEAGRSCLGEGWSSGRALMPIKTRSRPGVHGAWLRGQWCVTTRGQGRDSKSADEHCGEESARSHWSTGLHT